MTSLTPIISDMKSNPIELLTFIFLGLIIGKYQNKAFTENIQPSRISSGSSDEQNVLSYNDSDKFDARARIAINPSEFVMDIMDSLMYYNNLRDVRQAQADKAAAFKLRTFAWTSSIIHLLIAMTLAYNVEVK